MFEEFRKAYDEIEADEKVQELRFGITYLQEQLRQFEEPYRERMAEAEGRIMAAVLKEEKSITLFGVEARYFKGRISRSWKGIAMTFEPSVELILDHTTVGKPKVTVRIAPLKEG